jgi:hypothetical protein
MTQKMIFSDLQKNDIANKYLLDRMTVQKISLCYGISVTPIKSVLKELNVQIREPEETSRVYPVNENYFDNIDSFDKAYFLGLMFADGYNSEERQAITLSLVNKDRHILEEFVKCLNTNKPIRYSKSKTHSDTCNITICSKNISQRLAQLGCMQAKSLKIKFPDYLREDLIRHFIRGYFDGDGCFSCNVRKKKDSSKTTFSSVVTFTSTEDFCLYLRKYFEDKFNIHSYLSCRHPNNKNNNRTLAISGNKQVIKIMQWMYDDTDLYLKRKHDKFIEFCKIREDRLIAANKLRSANGKIVMANFNRKMKEKKWQKENTIQAE